MLAPCRGLDLSSAESACPNMDAVIPVHTRNMLRMFGLLNRDGRLCATDAATALFRISQCYNCLPSDLRIRTPLGYIPFSTSSEAELLTGLPSPRTPGSVGVRVVKTGMEYHFSIIIFIDSLHHIGYSDDTGLTLRHGYSNDVMYLDAILDPLPHEVLVLHDGAVYTESGLKDYLSGLQPFCPQGARLRPSAVERVTRDWVAPSVRPSPTRAQSAAGTIYVPMG
jgi:hypothetical protein